MKRLLVLLIFIIAQNSFAYVQNTIKGYANCMACHVSPNGGGILTDYGRSLSNEMMSTWTSSEKFAQPFYGALQNSENLLLGGQFRTIQVKAENDIIDVEKQFDMQNNVEFAAKYMNTFLVATVGTKEGPNEIEDKDEFLSERHYVLVETSENSRLRVGKFRQHFGINHANHTRFVKDSLGFGSYSETYNVEFSQYFENSEYNISSSVGELFEDEDSDNGKRNIAINYTHYIEGNSRVGAGFLVGKSQNYKRKIYNFNSIHPLSKKFFIQNELSFELKNSITNEEVLEEKRAVFGEHQLAYNAFKGGMAYFFFEHSQTDIENGETVITAPGIGFQFLPITHFEFHVEYQQRKNEVDPDNIEHRSFAMLHLYH